MKPLSNFWISVIIILAVIICGLLVKKAFDEYYEAYDEKLKQDDLIKMDNCLEGCNFYNEGIVDIEERNFEYCASRCYRKYILKTSDMWK